MQKKTYLLSYMLLNANSVLNKSFSELTRCQGILHGHQLQRTQLRRL